ncbi:ANTAR domain-containing protein [Williamsia soli]|uniref:ANTAR domain-containing protein n=1 Tax=Williamsia soli TaxID=364929 RepID=UPI001A9F5C3F|nr:ANTAR domain-containing protein [Williamsia soli]
MSRHTSSCAQIAAVARDISTAPPDTSATALDQLLARSTPIIAAADYAAVTIVERREHTATPAATHEHPRTLDAIAQKQCEGPAFVIAGHLDTFYIPDLYSDSRWPVFRADAAAQTPIRSIAAFGLFTTRDSVAALSLYADSADAFDADTLDLGAVLAAQAAMVCKAMQRAEQFRCALAHRDIIGQAKGMLMERFDLDAEHAFALLRKLSQDTNIRVYDAASKLIEIDHPIRSGHIHDVPGQAP